VAEKGEEGLEQPDKGKGSTARSVLLCLIAPLTAPIRSASTRKREGGEKKEEGTKRTEKKEKKTSMDPAFPKLI
jgi:hypothetical protein